ncbi:MAG: histidine kinase [Flavobacteriales bacterium]|nr:histidine kinase [Flavobacteriales bacterium]
MTHFNSIAKTVCLLLIVVVGLKAHSQQPSHFYLGSDEFANRHIYSLIHHSDKLLYVATNDGLLVYKNGAFKVLAPAPAQIGNSIFSLVGNGDGELHGVNLSGQIFKIQDDRLELVDQIPTKYLGAGMTLAFDENNVMIVTSAGVLKREAKGWKRIYNPSADYHVQLNSFNRAKILTPDLLNNKIINLCGNSFEVISNLPSAFAKSSNHFFVGELNNILVSMNSSGGIYNHQDKMICNFDQFSVREFIQLAKNEIWALDQTGGLQLISFKNTELSLGTLLFADQFISSISKSDNGTIYLGTFNHGIIVVPNINSDVKYMDNRYLSSVCTSPSGIVTIDNSGSVYSISQNALSIYRKNVSYERGSIMCFPGVDFGIDPDRKSLIYDFKLEKMKTLIGVLKDGVQVDSTTAILATSKGLFRKGSGASHLGLIDCFNGWSRIAPFNYRCRAVTFDANNGNLYYSTQQELKYLNAIGQTFTIKYHGNDIAGNDLMYKDGYIWCATQEFGILKIQNGKVVDELTVSQGLGDKYVFNVQFYDSKLFISHRSGFQVYNERDRSWKSIGTAEGVKNGSVRNFTFYNSRLYVLSRGKLISIPLDKIEKKVDYTLLIPFVKLGTITLDSNRSLVYSYEQNHLIAKFDFRGIEFESESTIQYRLIGLSDEWKSLQSTASEIEFNALAPGDYELQVRTRYRSTITKSQRYAFSISPPFWQTLGFYVLIIVLTSFVLFVIFRIRLKRSRVEQKKTLDQQKMQTDLFESELKALRSQMNPHFIFNSLNSIQALVLKEDTESSYDYITLFAKLVRNTLNYSNREFIPIESELEFLEVYLSLEKLRFGDKFEYQIVFDDEMNIDVPSLLLQPFIENALLHGLMHRKGIKKLSIKFELGEKLTCVIIDNGIGRVKAKEILLRRSGEHESFALSAIEQRMSLLNKQLGEEMGSYTIEDLYEGDNAIGTKVKLIIPFKRQY